ncbi:MAG: hypothetical protein KJ985_10340, partial [Proteobacteria bacterium]|nr:hypothetical protein [Pseudomonadota bacterium]
KLFGICINSTYGKIDSLFQIFNLIFDSDAEVIDAKRALVAARYDGLYAQYRILNGLGQLVKSFDKEWPKESQVTIGSLVESEKQ